MISLDKTRAINYYRYMSTTQKRQHLCDTQSPQRPCCWMARKAEVDAMCTPEAIAKQKAAQAAHEARLDSEGGFITRGLD
jgi:hypothetical protein